MPRSRFSARGVQRAGRRALEGPWSVVSGPW